MTSFLPTVGSKEHLHLAENFRCIKRPKNDKKRQVFSSAEVQPQFSNFHSTKNSYSATVLFEKTSSCKSGQDVGDTFSTNNVYLSNDGDNGPDFTHFSSSNTEIDVMKPSKDRNRKSEKAKNSVFHHVNNYYQTRNKVSNKDDRLGVRVNETINRGYLAIGLGASSLERIRSNLLRDNRANSGKEICNGSKAYPDLSNSSEESPPSLSIVVMIIGTRGDIQSFLKIGKLFKNMDIKFEL